MFGYYIEVSKSNLHAVPADYIRKQTIAGGERFITPGLKTYEEQTKPLLDYYEAAGLLHRVDGIAHEARRVVGHREVDGGGQAALNLLQGRAHQGLQALIAEQLEPLEIGQRGRFPAGGRRLGVAVYDVSVRVPAAIVSESGRPSVTRLLSA